MNFEKSIVFFNTNTLEADRHFVTGLLGVRSSNDVEKYLGLPNLVGKKKKISFQSSKDRIQLNINRWSLWFLSQGGKKVFIKSILQEILTYSMIFFLLPKALYEEMEAIIARYW